ncbi:NUDIX hydrolase [Gaoshiqia sp. Z1-71]|uniref:NUDIX hydrolase n=1 Tax=Gaoshiqia hydrogeniformans TaxID=3290090 RepID=UPI003BF80131
MMYSDIHPLNVLNYCPVCGSVEFHPAGDRAKKCEKCSFIWYFNSSAAVAALIFDDEGKLLLTRRAIQPHLGMLDLPGGFIEPMETAEQAICRELREELGVEVSEPEYFGSFPNEYPFSGMVVFTLDLVFRVKVQSLDRLVPMDDISGYEFHFPDQVDLDELPSVSMKQIVRKLVDLQIK